MKKQIEKASIEQTIEQLIELGKAVYITDFGSKLNILNSNYKKGIFRIVVIGEIKKGKSSFVNALLGQKGLLPVQDDIATSTVYKIIYGKEPKIRLYLKDKSGKITVQTISEDQVSEYGTEDGNPDNIKGVEFIGIQSPNPLIKNGLVIIDTPGLGGIIKKHKDITWRYIPNADAIFFVCDSVETLISKAEIEYLQQLKTLSPLIFFVQTKTDIVPKSQWEEYEKRNKAILSKELNVPAEKLIYFPVSSKLKYRADAEKSGCVLDSSGYSQLLYFLHNHLIPQKHERLFQNLILATLSNAIEVHSKLNEQYMIASAETKEKLDAIEKQTFDERTKYEQWRTAEYPELVRVFDDNLSELKQQTRDNLFRDLDSSPNGPLVAGYMKQIRNLDITSDDLNVHAQEILSTFMDSCAKIIKDILDEYNREAYSYCSDLSNKLSNSEFVADKVDYTEVRVNPIESLGLPSSLFEKTRSVMYGGIAGSTLATIITSLIFPPAGIIAALFGGAIGGFLTQRDAENRKKEEYIRKLESHLAETGRRMQSESIRCFESTNSQYSKRIRDVLQKAIQKRETELKYKFQDIQNAKLQSQEERKSRVTEIQGKIKETKQLIDYLSNQIQSDK
jgi:GTP-binding protein EngB required for normal cell division